MLIEDINTVGPSGRVITTNGGLFQMLINGTWNGGSVTVEKKIADDSWRAVATVTDNDFFMVESVGPALFRTNTVHGGSAPSLVCDVEFAPLSTEYKYGVSGTVRLA